MFKEKIETLEEAADRMFPNSDDRYLKMEFRNGAKWQQEKMYSKEDMLKCWNAAYIDALSMDEETYEPLFFENFMKQLKVITS